MTGTFWDFEVWTLEPESLLEIDDLEFYVETVPIWEYAGASHREVKPSYLVWIRCHTTSPRSQAYDRKNTALVSSTSIDLFFGFTWIDSCDRKLLTDCLLSVMYQVRTSITKRRN